MHSNYTECLIGWLFVVEILKKPVSLVGLGPRYMLYDYLRLASEPRGAFDLKYFTENLLTYFLPVRTTAQLCLKDQWAEYVENEES